MTIGFVGGAPSNPNAGLFSTGVAPGIGCGVCGVPGGGPLFEDCVPGAGDVVCDAGWLGCPPCAVSCTWGAAFCGGGVPPAGVLLASAAFVVALAPSGAAFR